METNPAETEQDEASTSPLDNDEQLQREIFSKLNDHNSKGKVNRMAEVQNARDQRLYFKGVQQFYWSEDRQDVIFDNDEDDPYSRTFNVFQGYGKIFQSTFMGARPKVRPEADDPFDSASIRNTSKAETYERVYRKYNDTPTMQAEASRLFWTDGRTVTRTVSRNGKEITEFWGVLESRLPATAKEDIEVPLKNCPLIELEDEYPMVQLKRDYPDDVRTKINSGNGDTYERNARLAVKRQAGTDTSIDVMSGEDAYGLATKTWSYMRPEFFEHFQEASRKSLQADYPSGLCVVHNGDVYLESYECDVDACLDVIHALPGDGMSRGSIGQPMMPLQDSANTAQNLIEETFDHGIPTTYYDTKTNIDGLNKQREMPGASRKATGLQGQPLSNAFYETTPLNPSQQLMNYVEDVKGPQSQFATGQQPALFGGDMTDQKTASGYAQARSMALGQMAIVWKPFTAWFAREMTRAIKMASQRTDDIKALLPSKRPGGTAEAALIIPGELMGLGFTNESDENFPETWTEKSNKLMTLMQDQDFKQLIVNEPANWFFVKEMIGLPELKLASESLMTKVLADIAQMENETPQPDPTQMPATQLPAMGQQAPPPPMVSSIKIDTEFLEPDDFATGFKTVKQWLLDTGATVQLSKPAWYANVRLYGLQYKQGMIAAQQAAAPAPEPPDLPKVVIPYDSLPAGGKVQAAAKADINITPADIATVPVKPVATGATNA
jgi:hypothetical protein